MSKVTRLKFINIAQSPDLFEFLLAAQHQLKKMNEVAILKRQHSSFKNKKKFINAQKKSECHIVVVMFILFPAFHDHCFNIQSFQQIQDQQEQIR